ncbi:MAG: hypothetical protein H6937_04990 [Burkholderiales bacterium]|nr:hypothetical protein [Burkholderiales bacterium]MDR4518072.1 hypothetical protein [Nitrosomonas sp.]
MHFGLRHQFDFPEVGEYVSKDEACLAGNNRSIVNRHTNIGHFFDLTSLPAGCHVASSIRVVSTRRQSENKLHYREKAILAIFLDYFR